MNPQSCLSAASLQEPQNTTTVSAGISCNCWCPKARVHNQRDAREMFVTDQMKFFRRGTSYKPRDVVVYGHFAASANGQFANTDSSINSAPYQTVNRQDNARSSVRRRSRERVCMFCERENWRAIFLVRLQKGTISMRCTFWYGSTINVRRCCFWENVHLNYHLNQTLGWTRCLFSSSLFLRETIS